MPHNALSTSGLRPSAVAPWTLLRGRDQQSTAASWRVECRWQTAGGMLMCGQGAACRCMGSVMLLS